MLIVKRALAAGLVLAGLVHCGAADDGEDVGQQTHAASCNAEWTPTWEQRGGANEWWVEYRILGGDVASAYLEVVGRGNVALSLSSNKWVGLNDARIPRGTLVVVHAETTRGQRAQTVPFPYLDVITPTSDRCESACTPSCDGRTCGEDGCGGSCGTCGGGETCAGGACVPSSCDGTFSPTWEQRQANPWWVEYRISGDVVAAHLEVVGGGTVPLSYQWKKWVGKSAKAIPAGTLVVVHAETSDGRRAKTRPFAYLDEMWPTSAPCNDACTPSCEGRTCGDDGCGGSCGECGGDPGDDDASCYALFDADHIPHFELTVDDAAMAILRDTSEATRKTWVRARFRYGSTTFEEVGLRRKGSSTFRAVPKKAAFKIRFDRYVKGQKLGCLTDLTLNNMTSDPTSIVERLSYTLFREAGLPAQKANTARVTLNGESYGIYLNVETPNQRFLERVFGDEANTIYEIEWGSTWRPGMEGGAEVDVGDDAKTDLRALYATVAAAKDATLLQDVASHLDTAAWLTFSAAEAAVGHYDGYGFGIWGSHNYFLAGNKRGVFSLVPWSTDLTMSDRASNLVGRPIVVDASQPTGSSQGDILLVRCKRSTACWNAYKTQMRAVLSTFESLDMENLARTYNAQLDGLIRADPKREASLSYYTRETARLYEWLRTRPGIIRAQLAL